MLDNTIEGATDVYKTGKMEAFSNAFELATKELVELMIQSYAREIQ